MPVVAFVVLLLIGVCLLIAGALLIVFEGIFDGHGSWIPWVFGFAGAWVISVSLSWLLLTPAMGCATC